MKAERFDKKFDDNKVDIINELDLFTLKRANKTQQRVNVDFYGLKQLEVVAAINSKKKLKD